MTAPEIPTAAPKSAVALWHQFSVDLRGELTDAEGVIERLTAEISRLKAEIAKRDADESDALRARIWRVL